MNADLYRIDFPFHLCIYALMTLRLGDRPGDLTFLRPDGTPVALSAFTSSVLVLIFLRHLA
jgi:hypothetical protein